MIPAVSWIDFPISDCGAYSTGQKTRKEERNFIYFGFRIDPRKRSRLVTSLCYNNARFLTCICFLAGVRVRLLLVIRYENT
jgi:hypothetical protein